jgi:hypothetical protein
MKNKLQILKPEAKEDRSESLSVAVEAKAMGLSDVSAIGEEGS